MNNIYHQKVEDSTLVQPKTTVVQNIKQTLEIENTFVRIIELEQEEYFVGEDIFTVLNIDRNHDAIRKNIKDEHKCYPFIEELKGKFPMLVIRASEVFYLLRFLKREGDTEQLKQNAKKLLYVLNQCSLEKRTSDDKQLRNKLIFNMYEKGEELEVVVTNIRVTGLSVKTNDAKEISGFIHINDLPATYRNQLDAFFKVGDLIHGKVQGSLNTKLLINAKDYIPSSKEEVTQETTTET